MTDTFSGNSAPQSWNALVETRPVQLHLHLAILPARAAVITAPPPGHIQIDFFRPASALLSEALALLGPRNVRPSIDLLMPPFEVALEEFAAQTEPKARSAEAALWFYNLVDCTGLSASWEANQKVNATMERFASWPLEPVPRVSIAWAAVALLRDELAERLLPAAGSDFLSRVAAACTAGGKYGDISECWLEYLRSFPHEIAAGRTEWPQLFCAGRAVYNRIAGLPVSDVARETHKQIMQLVSEGY
jgi:hypothetical protein